MNSGFLPLILIVLGLIPKCVVCQNEYETCREPFEECGSSIGIGYPFYGGNRPLSCGYPGYELSCQGGVPLVNIASVSHRVLAYDTQTRTVRVARNDLWNTLCPQLLLNITLNATALYNYYSPANDQDISLLYGCTGQLPSITFPNLFNCDANGTINGLGFIVAREAISPIPNGMTCRTGISVRVNETAGGELATNTTASLWQTSLQNGFSIQWTVDDQNCNDCVRSGGSCGFDQSSASFVCHCKNGIFPSTCTNTNGSEKGLSEVEHYAIIGLLLCVPSLVLTSISYYFTIDLILHYMEQESDPNMEQFLLTHGSLALKRYGYKEIKKMTKSFKDKLGQGGYGIVYKGQLPDAQLVAVKILTEIHDNAEEFINEVSSISRTSHVNIVNLLGFCYERNKRALVYEFMPNKSLDKFIYKCSESTDPECSLELDKLYQIALGVARGLEYLHRGCNTRIVHFDIKPQNILLDEDFCPKISDFGLAKLVKQKQSIISMFGARGTIGYIAPEVFSRNFGVVSHKSDVYSYGMMLLKMAEAREMVEIDPIQSSEKYFPENIYEHVLLKNKNLDDLVTDEKEETEIKMLMVGLWCIQIAPSDRPSMSKVVEMLEGSLQFIQIPPKPFYSSLQLSGPLQFSSSINMDTEISTQDQHQQMAL